LRNKIVFKILKKKRQNRRYITERKEEHKYTNKKSFTVLKQSFKNNGTLIKKNQTNTFRQKKKTILVFSYWSNIV